MYLLINLYEDNEIRHYKVPEMYTKKEVDDWIDKYITSNPYISWYTSNVPFKLIDYTCI